MGLYGVDSGVASAGSGGSGNTAAESTGITESVWKSIIQIPSRVGVRVAPWSTETVHAPVYKTKISGSQRTFLYVAGGAGVILLIFLLRR